MRPSVFLIAAISTLVNVIIGGSGESYYSAATDPLPAPYFCSPVATANQGTLATVLSSIAALITNLPSLSFVANDFQLQANLNPNSAVWRNNLYSTVRRITDKDIPQLLSSISTLLLSHFVSSGNQAQLGLSVAQFYRVLGGTNASLDTNIPANIQAMQVSTVIACLNSSNLFVYIDRSNYSKLIINIFQFVGPRIESQSLCL